MILAEVSDRFEVIPVRSGDISPDFLITLSFELGKVTEALEEMFVDLEDMLFEEFAEEKRDISADSVFSDELTFISLKLEFITEEFVFITVRFVFIIV